jgi:DNA-binding transcriptional LysR family regulator
VFDEGFDAGVRFGGTVPDDMIAQRLSAEVGWTIAGSPAYLAQHGVPFHPHDLAGHRCLQVRLGDDRTYRWEFEREAESLALAVPGTITHNNAAFATAMALRGAGLVYLPTASVAPIWPAAPCRPCSPTGSAPARRCTSIIPGAAICRWACAC